MSPQRAVTTAEYIISGRLPLYEYRAWDSAKVMVLVVPLLVIVMVRNRGGWQDAGLAAMVLIGGIVILEGFLWIRFRKRLKARPTPLLPPLFPPRETIPDAVEIDTNAQVETVIRQLEGRRSFWQTGDGEHWTRQELAEALASSGTDLPRTIVDEAAVPQVRQIPLPDHMLEPESILESDDKPRGQIFGLMIGFVLLGLVLLGLGNWPLALAMVAVAVIFSFGLPEVRDATRLFQLKQSETTVGLGVLTDERQRRWTVDDAVMLVQCKRDIGPLLVTFVGAAGKFTLSFTDERDPDFVTLWQRWNHPHPKPELL